MLRICKRWWLVWLWKLFPFLDVAQTESYTPTPLVAEWCAKPISHICAALQMRCPHFLINKSRTGGCPLFKTGTQSGEGNFADFVLIGMNVKSQTLKESERSEVAGKWTKPNRKCSPNGIFDTRASFSIHKYNGDWSIKIYEEKKYMFLESHFKK